MEGGETRLGSKPGKNLGKLMIGPKSNHMHCSPYLQAADARQALLLLAIMFDTTSVVMWFGFLGQVNWCLNTL